ncbi:hypothetical protein NVS55_20210 [Myxococcus stipitatus]|uniref:hypothetical protein n=1 Tax=Myxococcus stipitatus TaxID=83455 RepID=UPI00314539B7
MSIDFTTIISAPDAPLRDLLVRIESGLNELGFRHDHSILRAAYDSDREVFDELFPDEELRVQSGYDELPREVSLWEGCSCEFWNDSFRLYVLIGRIGHGAYVNVWVDITLQSLTRLLRRQENRGFQGALATISAAVDAYGGYGHLELAFQPLSPERVRTAFVDMPEFPGEPSLLGLIPTGDLTEEEVRKRYGSIFEASLSTQGYWVLTQDLVKALAP